MTNFLTGARLSRRRIVFLLTAIVAAAGAAIGLASSGQQVQQLVLAIAGVRWPYTPDVLPPFHHH